MRKIIYPVEIVEKCCAEYARGKQVAVISEETGISKSTIYRWIRKNRTVPVDMIPAKKELDNLRRKNARTEQICDILQRVDCTVSDPLRIKLYELEKLANEYPVRVLCDALQVDRGTFYNHMRRNKKENSMSAQRRKELSVIVKEVFEENCGLFGSDKILSVLQSRGYKTSKKVVRELMREMACPVSVQPPKWITKHG